MIASRRDVQEPASETPPAGSHPYNLPAKTERIDEEHDPARFESLDESMRKIAEELETAAIKWNRARPTHESFHKLINDWEDFSTARILELETHQIRFLGEWVTDEGMNYVSELNDYRQAIIKVWASREPEVVRTRLLENADAQGFVGREVDTWRNLNLDELCDDFHRFRVGHAMRDPKAAWEAFLRDDSDSRMKYLVDAGSDIPELIREYSSRAPEEAWKLTLTTTNEGYRRRMIEGFADGAPAGQDWNARSLEIVDTLAARGLEPSQWDFRSIAERWIVEDPVEALDWYARSAPADALEWAIRSTYSSKGADPFAVEIREMPQLEPEEASTLLKLNLLVGMYHSHKDRIDEVITALDRLATHDQDPIAARALGTLIGDSLDPMDAPLLRLIPKLPQREVRNELFRKALEAIPTRTGDPSSSSSDSLEGPNLTLEAVRELAGKLDLSAEIRTAADLAFRKVEAAELKAFEEWEQRRRRE